MDEITPKTDLPARSYELPELLYFGCGSTPSPFPHRHAFYQLEYCFEGKRLSFSGERKFVLSPGDFWVIPPDTPHRFPESGTPGKYLSLKFRYSGPTPEILDRDDLCVYHLECIRQLLQQQTAFSPYSPEGKFIIESHLAGVLRRLSEVPHHPLESPFAAAFRAAIYEQGAMINVDELAKCFHCSRAQFKYLYTKEYGGKTNIKKHIDELLLGLIENHVRYSNLSLTQIANELNFPSIYAFSRFYKRCTGKTLSSLRGE